MTSKPRLSPIAKKRLRRFIRHRRALISAIGFTFITITALSADLLCNDKPLVMQYQGKLMFPVIRFYPESTFIADGQDTRPDYKSLHRSPTFATNPANWMLFAPVPYGPRETIDEQDLIRRRETTSITLMPVAMAGSIQIKPDFTIVRERAAGIFFGKPQEDIRGLRVDNIWPIDRPLREAIQRRFSNQSAPSFEHTITPEQTGGTAITISMPEFTPRKVAPRFVRLTLRPAENATAQTQTIELDPAGESATPLWQQLRPQDQQALRELQASAQADTVVEVIAQSRRYRAMLDTAVAWPHPPIRGHWLGIDSAGRDVLARTIHGLRVSLFFSLLLVVTSMTIGTIIGALQGYYGGLTDILTQRAIEIWSAIPFLYVMILLGSVYGASFALLLFCYGLFNWIGISYYIRAEFLRLRNTAFVDAARVLGLRDHQIIFRHILPNALTPIITFAPFSLVGAVASLAALDYLGFGLPALTPSLGQMLHQAQTYRDAWWLIVYPSITLFVVMILGVFIGEGVREACDPRPRIRLEAP